MFLAVAILLYLHGLDSRVIIVNPDQITSMYSKKGPNKQVTEKTECVINLTDGKFVSVLETCEEVNKQLKGDRR